jgi:hypothetical protein
VKLKSAASDKEREAILEGLKAQLKA